MGNLLAVPLSECSRSGIPMLGRLKTNARSNRSLYRRSQLLKGIPTATGKNGRMDFQRFPLPLLRPSVALCSRDVFDWLTRTACVCRRDGGVYKLQPGKKVPRRKTPEFPPMKRPYFSTHEQLHFPEKQVQKQHPLPCFRTKIDIFN